MNKTFLFLAIVALFIICFVWKKKVVSKADMIDFLNMNVNNGQGKWVNLSQDELNLVYKPMKLIKTGVKPDEADYLKALEVLKKYGIEI